MLPLLIAAGIDVGHVVNNGVIHEDDIAVVDGLGVGWVRINMRLDTGTEVDEAWFAIYDRVIDAYLARGIEVYALINDEALASANAHGSDAWIADYVTTAVKIVDHFKNRVRIYEIINEPNDYAGGTTARFTPTQFAKILQDTYLAVKHDAGHIDDRCWQVQLISGPLFSFDGTTGADYLAQTFSIGKSELAWDYTHQATGSYPLDGVGYHMYVAQGTDSATSEVRTQMLGHLAAVDAVFSDKPIYVSEYGWEASAVGPTLQADRLTAGFNAMTEYGAVETAFYFNMRDFPGVTYGIFDGANSERPAGDALRAIGGVPLRAAVADITAPQSVEPGALVDVVVRVVNRGTEPWTIDAHRLAAAPGCPEASTANVIEWAPVDGYANGLTDARAFLPSAIPPGGTAEINVRVRAPNSDGAYTFAARMVHENDRFFGPTFVTAIHVARVDDLLEPIGPPRGCSCASSRDPSLLVAAFVLLGRRRRRRA